LYCWPEFVHLWEFVDETGKCCCSMHVVSFICCICHTNAVDWLTYKLWKRIATLVRRSWIRCPYVNRDV
jgi:hypothetical protein